MDRDRKRGFPDERDGGHRSKSIRIDGENGAQEDRPRVSRFSAEPAGRSPSDSVVRNGGVGRGIQSKLSEMAAESSANFRMEDAVNGNGRPGREEGGRRGQRKPRPTDAEMADFVKTRDVGKTKSAPITPDSKVHLIANYFPLDQKKLWNLYHYHVDFEPAVEKTYDKFQYFKPHRDQFNKHVVFDGSALYVTAPLADDKLEYYSSKKDSDEKICMKINPSFTIVGPYDPVTIQVWNSLLKACLRSLNLRLMGRYYYDSAKETAFIDSRNRLEIWPGYKTSFRQHEQKLMLNVDITNKVLHQDTIFASIRKLQNKGLRNEEITSAIVGQVVMTTYSEKSYKIDDLRWDQNPRTTFDMRGRQVSYAEYIEEKYNVRIRHMDQPIIISLAKRSEKRRGLSDSSLIPELCRLTGLTAEQRGNFNLMRGLSSQLQMRPQDRVKKIEEFSRKLEVSRVNENTLIPAGIRLRTDLVRLSGRQLQPERILFQNNAECTPQIERLDWTTELMRNRMTKTVDLKDWATVIMDDTGVETFLNVMMRNAKGMGFNISQPIKKMVSRGGRAAAVPGYLSAIDEILTERPKIQMIMFFLTSTDDTLYGEIKRRCYMDHGVPSQCATMRKINDQAKQQGVANKLAIQMNTKLGGIPWEVKIPTKGLMVVGYNISTMGNMRSTGGNSIGALVATTNDGQSQFYSLVVEQERGGQNLSAIFRVKMTLILHQYRKKNGKLPLRILFYRDGVGEGQLQSVVNTEVSEIKLAFEEVYQDNPKPFFGFIIVNKRTNTKFFTPPTDRSRGEHGNPRPGTVVDDVVTMPERYDFYLISQKGTGQGTVSPTAYNVIHDEINLDPARLQTLTYKLTHLYYNWSSPVAIPAVCHYAAKLAFNLNLVNKTGGRGGVNLDARPQLASTLYYI